MNNTFKLNELNNSIRKVETYLTEFEEFKFNNTIMNFKLNDLYLRFEYEGHPSYDGDFIFLLHDKFDAFNEESYSPYSFIDKFKTFIGAYNQEMLRDEAYFRNKRFYSNPLSKNDRFLIKSFFVYFLTEIAINKLVTKTFSLSYDMNDIEVDGFLLDLLVDDNPFINSLSSDYEKLIEYKKMEKII